MWCQSINETPTDFNSHAHVERDMTEQDYSLSLTDFNSHAHVERDSPTI